MNFISESEIDPLSVFTIHVILEEARRVIMRKKKKKTITSLLNLQNACDLKCRNCEIRYE